MKNGGFSSLPLRQSWRNLTLDPVQCWAICMQCTCRGVEHLWCKTSRYGWEMGQYPSIYIYMSQLSQLHMIFGQLSCMIWPIVLANMKNTLVCGEWEILAALYWEISTKILGAEHGSSRMGGLSRAVVVLGAFHKDILWLQDTTRIIWIAIITVIIIIITTTIILLIIIFFSFFILILLASAPKSKVADPDHSSWTDVPSEAQRSCSLRSGKFSGKLAKPVWR